jgi:hypothetical protein
MPNKLNLIILFTLISLRICSQNNCNNLGIIQSPAALIISEAQVANLCYTITNPSNSNATLSSLTIQLPLGLTNVSTATISGGPIISNQSNISISNPTFGISNWTSGTTLTICFDVLAPCVSSTSSNGNSVITAGVYSNCSAGNITIANVSLQITPTPNASSILKNIGDEDELIFKITNNSSISGSGIYQIISNLNEEQNIALLNYYTSNSVSNCALCPGTAVPNGPITLGASQFSTIGNNNSSLESNESIYLHIRYRVNDCDLGNLSQGQYDFSFASAPSVDCQAISFTTDIAVASGTPLMQASLLSSTTNSSYCNSSQSAQLGFVYTNSANPLPGAPAGSNKLTNLVVYLGSDSRLGSINPASIKVNNITVPVAAISQLPNQSFYEIYKIQFDLLNINSLPIGHFGGNTTLEDLDQDGFADDLNEGRSFTLSVDFSYVSTCPPSFSSCNDPNSYYSILFTQERFQNQCASLPGNPSDPGYSITYSNQPYSVTNGASANYTYQSTPLFSTINVPDDTFENTPFAIDNICPNFAQRWYSAPFGFDCPNGYYQMKILLPPGYHLDPGPTYNFNVTYTNPNNCPSGNNIVTLTAIEDLQNNWVTIDFTNLTLMNCSGVIEPLRISCFSLPFTLICQEPDVDLFGVHPDVFSYLMEFICDPNCNCTDVLSCASDQCYHHCDGACSSPISTVINTFSFLRNSLGWEQQPNPLYPNAPLVVVNPNTTSNIRLNAAYPGDEVVSKVNGKLQDTPSLYSQIRLQLRYDQLGTSASANPVVFDIDPVLSSIHVYDANNNNAFVFSASSVVFTTAIVGNEVHLNFDIPQSDYSSFNSPVDWLFVAEIHLRVKTNPFILNQNSFLSYGDHPLVNLRAEYRGSRNNYADTIRSCDHFGASFRILQPYVSYSIYAGTNGSGNTICGNYSVKANLQVKPALEGTGQEDFPNEYKPYAAIDDNAIAIVPQWYSFTNAYFEYTNDTYLLNPGTSNFTGNYYMSQIPVSGYSAFPAGNDTQVNFNGISQTNTHWPYLDQSEWPSARSQTSVVLNLEPQCSAPSSATFIVKGGYHTSITAPQNYQNHFPAPISVNLLYNNPNLSIPAPSTINALTNQIQFTFQYCNNSSFNAANGWISIENSAINSIGFNSSSAVNLSSNTQLPVISYSNGPLSGILIFIGNLSNGCITIEVTATVLQCTNVQITDSLFVQYGYSCAPNLNATDPSQAGCISGTTQFFVNRYPASLNLLSISAPITPANICSDTLSYGFIIQNPESTPIDNPLFLVDLPQGLSLSQIEFVHPANSSNAIILQSPSYVNGSILVWDLESILTSLPNSGLPGSGSNPNNEISVHVIFKTACDYVIGSPILFSTEGTTNCLTTITANASHTPSILNAPNPSNLGIQIFSGNNLIDCANGSTISVIITNNGNTTANNNIVQVSFPSNLSASNISNNGNGSSGQVSWSIPSVASNGSMLLTFDIGPAPNNFCSPITIQGIWSYADLIICNVAQSCPVTASSAPVSITINACCSNCIVNAGSDITICSGNSTTLSASGGSNYLWMPGNLSSQSITVSPTVTTTYTVTSNSSSNGTCTDYVTVFVNGPIVVTINPNPVVVCYGQLADHVNASASGGMAPYSYSWSPSVTTTNNGADAFQLPIGTYTVTATDAMGCFGSIVFTITQSTPITYVASNVNLLCANQCTGSSTITPSGGTPPYTYTWNTFPAQYGATAINLCAQTYTCTITDSNGCFANATVIITRPTALYASIVQLNTNTSCSLNACNGSAQATGYGGTPPYNYSWNTVPAQSNSVATNLCAGTYTCTITDANGCIYASSVNITTSPSTLNAVITLLSLNRSCNSNCNGSASVTAFGGNGPYSYSWSTSPVQTSSVATGLCAGNYTCTITDASGCLVVRNITIAQAPPLSAISSVTNVTCYGGNNGSATVTATGGSSPYTYLWNTSPPQVNATANNLTAGTYSCTITDLYGCTITVAVTITQSPSPLVGLINNITQNTSCVSPCNGSATAVIIGGSPPYTYSWNTSPIQTSATASALCPGNYTCTITDSRGCVIQRTTTILQAPALNASTSVANVSCYGGNNGTATVVPFNGTPMYTYQWNTNPAQTTQTASLLTAGTYSCVIGDSRGCSVVKIVTVTQPSAINITGTFCRQIYTMPAVVSANIILSATITGGTPFGSGTPYTYSWSLGTAQTTNNNITSTKIFYTSLVNGANTVTLTVTDANGCVKSQQFVIYKINNSCAIPNSTLPGVQVCYNNQTYCISQFNYQSWMSSHPGAQQGACNYYPCNNQMPMVATSDMQTTRNEITMISAPNPSDDYFHINIISPISDNVTINIYDVNGNLVEQLYSGNIEEETSYQFEFNASNLSSGMYLIHLVSNKNGTIKMSKLILQR